MQPHFTLRFVKLGAVSARRQPVLELCKPCLPSGSVMMGESDVGKLGLVRVFVQQLKDIVYSKSDTSTAGSKEDFARDMA